MSNNPTTATFSLYGFPQTATATVLDENRTITINNGVFSDSFVAYGVHLYEINYSPDPGADFQILQQVALDVKPQNQNQGNGVMPITILSDANFDTQNIDFETIRLLPEGIAPVKFPLFTSNGKDHHKDMLVFFLANEPFSDLNQKICLEGKTGNGQLFKACSP
ncbi:MAG: hypothetical protein UV59_C0052G0001, partial [Candidatus Gottesmanbacteria bacterium GW2011_GWA1_43_11]